MIRLFCLCVPFLLLQHSQAQFGFSRHNGFPVIEAGDTLKNAWAGALNVPQFSEIDLNGDGIKDLFVYEKEGYSSGKGLIKTFLNGGTASAIDYTYAPEYQSVFPDSTYDIRNFVLLVDYNCDGYEDLFTFSRKGAGIQVFKNKYSPGSGVGFSSVSNRLETDYGGPALINIYLDPRNIPALTDINNDGDLDILTFGIASQQVGYHENQSMELYGHCDSLVFTDMTHCWGEFAESIQVNCATLGQPCKGIVPGGPGTPNANGGSTLLAFDADGDRDKDILMGQVSFKNMAFLRNGGDTAYAVMDSMECNFPSYDTPLYLSFPAAYHVDLNNDSKRDLIASVNTQSSSENLNNTWFYENIGTDASPIFNLKNNAFLTDGMIEVGSGCNPTFFDHNGDGLQDLVIGNYGYLSGSIYISKLALYENIGSSANPVFELVTTDYANAGSLNKRGLYPTFGDIDDDGDMDMIAGDYDGKLYLFKNQAGAGNKANFLLPSAAYMNIDVGKFATPQLIDVDRDGTLDLIVGEEKGNINYFQNQGTKTLAIFPSQPTNDLFGNIDVMVPCCTGYSSPYLVELSANQYTLFVGSEEGNIYRYENIDSNLNGSFLLVDSLYTHGLRISVSGMDLDADDLPELIYGQYAGGPTILKQSTASLIEDRPTSTFNIFPNPFEDKVTVAYSESLENCNFSVHDLIGRKVMEGSFKKRTTLDMSSLTRGTYLIVLYFKDHKETKKLVKL